MRNWLDLYFLFSVSFGTIGLLAEGTLAQSVIVPDGTLGVERSTLTPAVIQRLPSERIEGGAIRDINLFHSFEQFNIGEGRGAYFANPVGVQNILSRVTGNERSEILGRLGVLGNANLFLLNPNGIVFGPNADLDVLGSFTATTANAIGFGDRGFFSATQPQQSSLLSVAPGALLYNQSLLRLQGADITSSGNLVAGKDLTLAATNLNLQGQLQAGRDLTLQGQDTVQILDSAAAPFLAIAGRDLLANGGRSIDIFTLDNAQSKLQSERDIKLLSNGEIVVDTRFLSGGNLSFLAQSILLGEFPQSFKSRFGTTIYANGDVLFGDYTGASLKIEAIGNIRGRNIKITGTHCVSGLLICFAGLSSSDPDFDMLTREKAVILRSGIPSVPVSNLSQNLGSISFIQTLGLTPGITVSDIETFDVNGGDGGAVILTATNGSITTDNITASSTSPITIFGNEVNGGNGGDITLKASGDITVKDLSSSSGAFSRSGDAGNAKNGGAIALTAMRGRISAENINSSSTSAISFGSGNAGSAANGGSITLTALNGIRVGSLQSYSASISQSGDAGVAGNGGAIILNTINGNVNMGQLDTSSFSKSDPGSNSDPAGNSGNAGNGGGISITAGNGSIIVNTNSSIFPTRVTSSSNSGSFGQRRILSGGTVTVGNSGNAGDITLSATNGSIIVPFIESTSSASTFFFVPDNTGNAGNGGNVTLTAMNGNITTTSIRSFSLVSPYSSMIANIGNAGNGGNIAGSSWLCVVRLFAGLTVPSMDVN